MSRHVRLCRALLGLGLLLPSVATAQTASALDAQVQPPQLAAPQRGSLVGQLANVAFGPGDLSRGAFTLPAPIQVPEERGRLLASPFPSYATDNPISEWGIGWASAIAITRTRLVGDLDFATDDLSSPFGRLVKGADGYWYPVGLAQLVRVSWSGDVIVAHLPDGTKMTFGGAARITSPRGTYAWYLTAVESATGHQTRLEYQTNATGRPFLSVVRYGGAGADFQYRVELGYEAVPLPFMDYRPGRAVTLDRRVKTVRVLARHADTGAFEERWRYELGYVEEALGPGFYLERVQQVFAGGEAPPPARYTYHLASQHLAGAQLAYSPKLTQLVRDAGTSVIQPNDSAALDFDLDGRTDLEHSDAFWLVRQTDEGFAYEAPPEVPPDVVAGCRPEPSAYNLPRTLAQLRADSDEHFVVHLDSGPYGLETWLNVCDRAGSRVGAQQLVGDWRLSALTKLADLDRDRRPDLVHVDNGFWTALPNTSGPHGFEFGAERGGPLTPAFTPEAAWVHDLNGDGLADLVARYSSGLVVWFGKGSFEFEAEGLELSIETPWGPLTNLSDYAVTFVDANKDGLTDLLLSRARENTTYLFTSQGFWFLQTDVPGLLSVDAYASHPVVADFSGSGNAEVAYSRETWNGPEGYVVQLDTPSTGLLASADDGEGTVLRFEYARNAAAPGVRQRASVLARLTVESSGYGAAGYDFTYGAARLHSTAKFLVGFDRVTRTDPTLSHSVDFLNDDRNAGLFSASVRRDLVVGGVEAWETRSYADATYQGLPWKRLAAEASGRRSTADPGSGVSERTEYLAYERDVCASTVRKTGAAGTLLVERRHATLPSLSLHLACLPVSIVESGTHADPSLDFRHETTIERNALGLVTSVSSGPAAERLKLQDVGYDAEWRISAIVAPGRGTTTFEYAPGVRLVRRIAQPDGVVMAVTARDPVKDHVLALRHERGALAFTQSFRFDGQERLRDVWDDLGGATALNPRLRYTYDPATATQPAAVLRSELVDAATASALEAVDLLTAAGEPVATATRIPQGWSYGALVERLRSVGETRKRLRPALPAAAHPMSLDYAALAAGSDVVERDVVGPLGAALERTRRHSATAEQRLAETLAIEAGALVKRVRENGVFERRSAQDGSGLPLADVDEAGVEWRFRHDALGRPVEVSFPDGAHHRARYDVHGRLARVEREGVATVTYAYSPSTGLPSEKRFLSPAGVPQRTVAYEYDPIGRVVAERHTDAVSGATTTFRSYWDGSTPAAPSSRTTPGLLTAVTGDGYSKELQYRADGKVTLRRVALTGWRTVETAFTYLDDGSVRERTVSVSDAAGASLSRSTERYDHDAYGRLSAVARNGATFETFAYDANGLPAGATFADGTTVALRRDPVTRRLTGASQTTAGVTASTDVVIDARGLVATELSAVGATRRTRSYGYSPRRFLTSATDAVDRYAYDFDASGLSTRIEKNGVSRAIARTGDTLVAGGVTYRLDALGRVVQRGDLALAYGPDGQLARATRGTTTWTFVHDEAGQRLLKRANGVPVAAYLDEGYLDAAGLAEPVRVAGRVVGVVRGSVFEPVPTDTRGTPIAAAGAASLASPFGDRATRPASAAYLDFVERGYDRDLGLVRMGVRDYDPALNRFTTPDPLFLEDLAKVIASPLEGNLYAYAANLPTLFHDPTGLIKLRFGAGLHNVLDAVGLIPGVGDVVDLVHAGIYLAEGNYVQAGLSAVSAIPGVGDVVGKGGKLALRVGQEVAQRTGAKALREATTEVTEKVAREAGDGAAKRYARPSGYRTGVRDEVWENAREATTGQVRDPATGRFMSKDKPWDMGHKPGYEFRKHADSAADRNLSRKEFLDEHNDPGHYRPELPSSNRSHASEDLTDTYLGT